MQTSPERRPSILPTLLALAALPALAGCSVLNRVDVCERSSPPERQLNLADPVGYQFLEGPQSLVAMPSGRPFVVFTSIDSTTSSLGGELRGSLLDESGQPTPTCGARLEVIYAAADPALERRTVVAAPPISDVARGLLAWVERRDPGNDPQVVAHFIGADACPLGDALEVSADTSGALQSIALAGTAESRFVVVWASQSLTDRSRSPLRARVVERPGIEATFLPTDRSAVGDAVDLPTPDAFNVAVMATSVDVPRRFALAWIGSAIGGDRVYVRVFDDALRPVTAAVTLDESTVTTTASLLSVSVAHQEGRLFVAWTRLSGDDTRAYGAIVSTDGALVRSAFALDATAGRQTRVAATPIAVGGFLAAWTTAAAGGGGTGIRALAVTRDGNARFTNRACDAAPFGLEASTAGDQFTPALALLPSGSLATAWTDAGRSGPDMSETGIRGIVFAPLDLFPLDE